MIPFVLLFISKDDSSSPEPIQLSDEAMQNVREQAMIYRKPKLTHFQQMVNTAATELALHNPVLIQKGNRGELLERARSKVSTEGYNFKKGKSRSKKYGEGSAMESTPKRPKFDEDMRRKRKKELEEDIEDLTQVIRFKEKRCSQAETTRNYKVCDQLTEEQMELKKKRRELEAELTIICRKEKRAQRYLSHKSPSESAGTSKSPPFLSPGSPFSHFSPPPASTRSERSSSVNSNEEYFAGSEAETSREPSIPPEEQSF